MHADVGIIFIIAQWPFTPVTARRKPDPGPRNSTETMHAAQAVKKEVDEAVEKAKQGTIPAADQLWKNIYHESLGAVMRGMDSQTKIKL